MKLNKTLSLVLATILAVTISGCGKPQEKETGVKTGMGVITTIEKSTEATADKAGLAQVDSVIAAVTVGNDGKILKCVLDAVQTKVNFSQAGEITTDLKEPVASKNELGTLYDMKKASKIGKEWNEQAESFANYVTGKTLAQVKGIAVNESGVPTESDLTASVTIHVTDFIAVIEKAVNNAKELGAKNADTLGLGIVTAIDDSINAGEKAGLARAYSNYGVVTFDNEGKITSSMIDSSQGDVNFSKEGKITSDLKTSVQTKNELGAAYNMKKQSKIGKEWNEQAESFAKYVVGKTVDQVKGIAVNESGAPTDSELASSVTVHITDFISVIEKAKATAK